MSVLIYFFFNFLFFVFCLCCRQGDHKEASRYLSRANEIWEMAYSKPAVVESDNAGAGDDVQLVCMSM